MLKSIVKMKNFYSLQQQSYKHTFTRAKVKIGFLSNRIFFPTFSSARCFQLFYQITVCWGCTHKKCIHEKSSLVDKFTKLCYSPYANCFLYIRIHEHKSTYYTCNTAPTKWASKPTHLHRQAKQRQKHPHLVPHIFFFARANINQFRSFFIISSHKFKCFFFSFWRMSDFFSLVLCLLAQVTHAAHVSMYLN